MRAVAEGLCAAHFAAAPGHLLFFGDFHEHGAHTGGAMRSVAEGLFFRLAAAAPDIFTWLHCHDVGFVFCRHIILRSPSQL
jgi:hypothetical protein